jgi:membrane-bound serine protease (ClpP class)
VTQDLVVRALERANAESAHLVVLELDTPGGLDHSMRQIISAILASDVPVVSWVTPQGARAASAGTYILYASHIAAMSPATNLGAATPVSIGAVPGLPDGGSEPGGAPKDAMSKKIINDASAYITGLAQLRGRNAEWAEQAVREAVSLTAEEALRLNVIDLIASDRKDLFRQLDGRSVMVHGSEVSLSTQRISVEHIQPDWRSRLLAIISDPNVAYLLLLAGIYGLIIEFTNPGYVLPGVVGSISLLLALYAFQILPVNYVGLLLLAFGLAFIIGEAFITSGGVLGIGGVVAFVVGSIILFDDPNLGVSLPLVGGVALIAAGFLFWFVGKLVALRRKKVITGRENMVGLEAIAMDDIAPGKQGRVKVEGESWLATSDRAIKSGQKVIVNAVNHLLLKVSPKEET